MSKRKLSDKQRSRIEANQAAEIAQASEKSHLNGIVIARYGANALVHVANHPSMLCAIRPNCPEIVIGDNVQVAVQAQGQNIVNALLPRRNLLSRMAYQNKEKLLASNIDTLCIVLAPEPVPEATTLDRYLMGAEAAHIPPIIIVNKSDLLTDKTQFPLDMTLYEKLGYRVFWVSCKKNNWKELAAVLSGNILLVGQSGVGKSSLINTFVPDKPAQVGALSLRTGLGQHTTTTAQCYALPQGGWIMDSPGIRQFNVHAHSLETLCQGFIEFAAYLGKCRFRNCCHRAEPDCAVKAAVETGAIAFERYQHYLIFLEEMENTPL